MLEIVRAASMPQLAARCAQVLAVPPADPLCPEWIATPTPGIGRWLALELARTLGSSTEDTDDGIAANIDFAGPVGLRRAVLDADPNLGPRGDPWSMELLIWSLYGLRESAGDTLGLPELAPGSATSGWARRIGGLFSRYDRYRPDLLRAWAAGGNRGPDGAVLDASQQWQPRLFRALRDHLGMPCPAERIEGLSEAVAEGTIGLDLPARLMVVGFAGLPGGAEFTGLLRSVAVHHDVFCGLLDPAPHRSSESWNELALSWGVSASESRLILDDAGLQSQPGGSTRSTGSEDLLLRRFQRAVSGLDTADADGTARADGSLCIHGAQGARRQVEVLRDSVCARLAADPTLREDDIVVCCPDLDRFAPLIQSIFGDSEWFETKGAGGPVALRYLVDGGAEGPQNPVVDAVAHGLELVTGRFSALDVVEFCGREAVRRRWDFDDEALGAIRNWVEELDVRWGLDADHRAASGVPGSVVSGTWRRALDRLAIGVACARDDVILDNGTIPVGVEGDRVAILGRLTDLVNRLALLADTADIAMPIEQRLVDLEASLHALVTPEEGLEWQLDAVTRMCRVDLGRGGRLAEWTGDVETDLVSLRPELLHRLRGGGHRSRAFRGGITVASPTELAGVPYRVVYLLGLDDVSLPSPIPDGDDLAAPAPRPGDPSRRSETIGGLLAAVLAATDAVEILHDNRDLTTNEEAPDGVALAELITAIGGVSGDADEPFALEAIRVSHPRHASDIRCFLPDAIVPGRRWGFDDVALGGARARLDRVEPALGADHSDVVVHVPESVVALADLGSFYKNPARFVCREVLGVRIPDNADELESHLRVSLDGLERHGIRSDVLAAFLASEQEDPDRLEAVLVARDRLPVGALGAAEFSSALDAAETLDQQAREHREGEDAGMVAVQCDLPGGRRIVGQVDARRTAGGYQLFSVSASSMKIGDRLRAWVEMLALAATHPDADCEAVLIRQKPTKNRSGPDPVFSIRLATADRDRIGAALADLVRIYDRMYEDPIVLALATFSDRLSAGGPVEEPEGEAGLPIEVDAKRLSAWNTELRYSPELAFLAGDQTLADLVDLQAHPDDPGPRDRTGRLDRLFACIEAAWASTVESGRDAKEAS